MGRAPSTAATVTGPDERVDFWAAHRNDTRGRIVDAFLAMMAETNPVTVSMPAVAARAGVSVRTLYRYFPGKDDLQRVAAGWLERGSRAALGGEALGPDNVRAYLTTLWRDFSANLSSVHVQHATVLGRALRAERLPQARAIVDRTVPPGITGRRRDELVDLLVAIASSSMFLELVDRMGHRPERAAAVVADAIALIIDASTEPEDGPP